MWTSKLEFIRRLEDCGVRRIEAVSFVNPRRVPQMAGAEEIMAALPREPAVRGSAWCSTNAAGTAASASGCDEANVVVCATDAFGVRNQGATVSEQVQAMATIVRRRNEEGGPPISVTISVAFGCPFEGEVPVSRVVAIARAAAELGVVEIALADTIGVADPWAVRERIAAARAEAPDARLRLHFHDTRGAASPTPSPAWRRGCGCWTPAAAAWAAAPSPRRRPATSPPRIWSGCSTARGFPPASTWRQ